MTLKVLDQVDFVELKKRLETPLAEHVSDLEASIVAPLFDLEAYGYFTSIAGYTNARYEPFTDAAKHIYAQIFSILTHFEVEYYVFAGTLVGYIRNGQMPPWMDDIDIMIFEKDIEFFENKIAPFMLACGFNCRPVAKHHAGGGYHVLSLQKSGTRTDTIPFSATRSISIPWVQVDIFYSKIDDNDIVRNLTGWGLYHRKDVPLNWVIPPQTIRMNELEFSAFANIEADVRQEYGDVRKELVVKTHGKTFLSAAHVEWDVVDQEFSRLVNATVSPLTPSVTPEAYRAYTPLPERCCIPPEDASFDEIMTQIVRENAAEVQLQRDDQIFWVMDIKRLAPNIHLSVRIGSLIAAKHAAHLRQFIDEVAFTGSDLKDKYDDMISTLKSVLGDQTFPGARQVEDIF